MKLFIIALFLCSFGEPIQHILVDQFGYRPGDAKVAVIKNPKIGLDANLPDSSFVPGSIYKVVNAATNKSVFEGVLTAFNSGEVDEASGDQIWWFDFTKVVEPGQYYVSDEGNNASSYPFYINEDVYKQVLKVATKMLYYQRSGFPKEAKYAGKEWADEASHLGPGQDLEARLFDQKENAETARDVHGGWYDAGDFNKYTPWTTSYIDMLMHMYLENPDVWTDDFDIPESGNGLPDILDEAKWGLDWVVRMQEQDGSVLCIVGEDGTFPPSATTGASFYGPATARASWGAAKAFSISSVVFRGLGQDEYADELLFRAIRAWSWAEANPDVKFHNNNNDYKSQGLGAGDQEEDDEGRRLGDRLAAALNMYEATKDPAILKVFEDNVRELPLFQWSNFVSQYWAGDQYMFLQYLGLDGVSERIKADIRAALLAGFAKPDDYAGQIGKSGYRSFIDGYNWGSNQHLADMGAQFYLVGAAAGAAEGGGATKATYQTAAADYLHYFHGVNPFGLVYLTNMERYGATKSASAIFHTWFNYDSEVWGRVTDSTPGPAPGYVPGGANQWYTWDGCCPDGCGEGEGWSNNVKCFAEDVPVDEPPAKMYKDFNYNWPLDSWALTEPDVGYQVSYLRLLSKFVSATAAANSGKKK